MNNSTLIAITEAQSHVKRLPEGASTDDKLRAAMSCTYRHWACTNEDDQFRAAIGAVMLESDDETRHNLELELKALQSVSMLVGGFPIDLPAIELPENPIGILKFWDEAKAVQS